MTMEVDMILGDATAATETNRNYAAFQLSLECAKNEYLTDRDQRATYYLGGICCLLPEVTDDLQEAVRSMGRTVRTISFPSAAARNGLLVPPKIVEPKKAIALFGYLVIMLYKNDIEVSSDQHLKTLFDAVGYVPIKGEDVSVFNDENHSTYLRSTYGKNPGIGKAVLKGVLNHTKDGDSFGDVCSYVARILSLTDMSEFLSTVEILLESPVFRAPELVDEVKNLRRACKAILNTEMLMYYMIMENPESYSILDSSNFPTLTAVARKLRLNEEICEVDYYVVMHKNHLRGISARENAYSDEED